MGEIFPNHIFNKGPKDRLVSRQHKAFSKLSTKKTKQWNQQMAKDVNGYFTEEDILW